MQIQCVCIPLMCLQTGMPMLTSVKLISNSFMGINSASKNAAIKPFCGGHDWRICEFR